MVAANLTLKLYTFVSRAQYPDAGLNSIICTLKSVLGPIIIFAMDP